MAAPLLSQFPSALSLSPQLIAAQAAARGAVPPTPVSAEPVDQASPAPPNGTLTDIGHGFAGGAMVDLPTMAGQALQAFSPEGSDLYKAGQQWRDAAEARKDNPAYQTTGAWGAGARAVAPSVAAIGAGAVTALAAPFVGVGVGALSAVGSGVAAAGLFGGSTYQDTLEQALKAGATPEDAHAAALKAGAVMSAGQAIASAVGGKILAGAGAALGAKVAEGGLQNGLDSFASLAIFKNFSKNFSKNMLEMMGVNLPVQAGSAAALNAIDQGVGIDTKQTSWEAAKASLAPTAAMTVLLGPLAAVGAVRNARAREQIADSVTGKGMTPPEMAAAIDSRTRSLLQMGKELGRVTDPETRAAWQDEAQRAINLGEPVRMQADFTRDSNVAPAPAPAPQLALPASRIIPSEGPTQTELDAEQQQAPDYAAAQAKLEGPDYVGAQQNLGNQEARVQFAKSKLPTAPGDVLRQLAEVAPAELPQALHEIWMDRGGPSGKVPKFVEHIGDWFKQETGRDIEEVNTNEDANGNQPGEAATEVGKGAKSESTALQTEPQAAGRDEPMAQAQGDAFTRSEVGGAAEKNLIPLKPGEAPVPDGYVKLFHQMDEKNVDAVQREGLKAGEQDHAGNPSSVYASEKPFYGDSDSKAMVEMHVPRENVGANNTVKGDVPPEQIAAIHMPWHEVASHIEQDPTLIKRTLDGDFDTLAAKDQPAVNYIKQKYGSERIQPATAQDLASERMQPATAQEVASKMGASSEELPPVPTHTGDLDASTNRQAERGGQHQDRGTGGEAAQAGAGDSPVPSPPRRTEAGAKAEKNVVKAKATLDAFDTATQAKSDRLTALNGEQKVKQTKEGFAQQQKLGLEIQARRHGDERQALVDKHEEAAQLAENAHVAAYRAGAHLFAAPGAPEKGSLVDTLSYVAAKDALGLTSPAEKELLVGRDAEKRGDQAEQEAAAALKTLTRTQTELYEGRAKQLLVVRAAAGKMMEVAKSAEAKVTRSLSEHAMDEGEFSTRLQALDHALEQGLISPEEHETKILATEAEAQDRNGIRNRGLAGLSDNAFGAKVAETPHAGAIMTYIGETHHDPLVRAVAKMLAKDRPNAPISIVEQPDFDGGRYDSGRHIIEIGRGGMNPVTVMHETVHSLMHAGIHRAMDDVHRPAADLDPRAAKGVEALRTIQDVMGNFRKMADLTNPEHRLALQDEHEFSAEALNNPNLQQLLGGRSGLMTRFWNAVRGLVGLEPQHQTDFERLMGVSPTLFGPPSRDPMHLFNAALDRTGVNPDGSFNKSPRGQLGAYKRAGEEMERVSASAFKAKLDGIKLPALKALLSWTTYNNGKLLLDRAAPKFKARFPQHAAEIDRLVAAYATPKSVLERRASMSQQLMNGPKESNELVARQRVLSKMNKGQDYRQLGEFQHRVRQAGIDPRDKTFAEAQKRNPQVTQEMFDAPLAKTNRDEWKRMKGRDGNEADKVSASNLFEETALHHELSLARTNAASLDNIRQVYGLGRDKDLSFMSHIYDSEGRSEQNPQVQLDKLNGAMKRTQGQLDAQSKAAGFNPASTAGKDVTSAKAAVDDLIAEHKRQVAVPYTPRTRSGEFMVHFDIADKPGLYEQIRKHVAGTTEEGGLYRDMGPEVAGGSRTVDIRFDNELQQRHAEKLFQPFLEADAFKNEKGENTWASGRTEAKSLKNDGASPAWMRKYEERVNSNLDYSKEIKEQIIREAKDMYLQQMPEGNPMKAAMFSDGHHGAEMDMINSFAKRQEQANNALVSAVSSSRMGEAMSEVDAAMKGVRSTGTSGMSEIANTLSVYADEIKGRVKDMETAVNTPTYDKMRAFAAPFRLALSPAYMLMTWYQPMQMTLPWLGAKYGWKRGALAMAGNYGTSWKLLGHLLKNAWDTSEGSNNWQKLLDVANPTVDFSQLKNKDGSYLLNGARLQLMNRLQQSNLLNFGQFQQIWRPRDAGGAEATKGVLQDVNRLASVLPHFIEMSNRMVAALSAHELALHDKSTGKMKENPTEAELDAAHKEAMATIRNTDGDHSQGNLARKTGRRGFLGGATPLVIGFGQYDLQMTESLVRTLIEASTKGPARMEAVKKIGGVIAMTSVMSGTLGMPFMGLYTGLYNGLMGMLQDNSEEPPDFEKSWRDSMSSIFGEKGGEIVSRGVPRLFDIDMSQRSGYADLAPFTSLLTDRQKIDDTIKDQALNFAGPAIGIGVGAATGIAAAIRGNYPKAINDALPAFMRNAAKAYRMSQYGYERLSDSNESIPLPVSTWNIIAQAGGFGSGAKADVSEQSKQWSDNQNIMERRNAINRNKWLLAQAHGDAQGMSDAMQAAINTAIEQPQYRNQPAEMADAYRQRQEDLAISSQFGGVHLTKSQVPFYNQFQSQGGPPQFSGQ